MNVLAPSPASQNRTMLCDRDHAYAFHVRIPRYHVLEMVV